MSEKKRAWEDVLQFYENWDEGLEPKETVRIANWYIAELEQQIEAARREGFDAGRERFSLGNETYCYTYEAYADYAKSREGK